ncbi:MHYT domain-containing protein [Psychromonas sp. L1A2]|uniref:MHYT domain-containing protein n=1 Tax=Psychromonas sp. L1A2 TaxID=2686356 RepID=UPI0013571723|nr:MHYT domain-containing protein [Psychromonas sp. L1A2]
MLEQILEIFNYNESNLFVLSKYNPWLVTLSISIAILASFMGFQVAHQAQYATPIRKKISLIIGSIVLGGGVWSMHFLGMLALDLCTNISYQIDTTLISVLPSIAASWVTLNLITRKEIKSCQLVFGGVLVGSGIGAMHYIGMAAMEMAPLLRYDPVMFIVSILVAVILAILALWISFGLDKHNIPRLNKNIKIGISSCVMGAAIAGMHYVGMLAARFVLPPGMELSEQTSEISTILALIVTGITVVVIFLVLGANIIFRYKDISATAMNNERRLIATMNTAIDGIITIDSKGIIISVNKAVSTLLAWSSEELIGQNVKIILPLPYQASHDPFINDYLQIREAEIIDEGREVEALAKDGEKIPVRLGIGHVELNNQLMCVAFISDLRERKAMESSLRNKEAKIRSLVANIPGIAYRHLDTPGWPSIFINDEVEKMLGYPAEDFLLPNAKRTIADFVHPEDMQIILDTDLYHPDGYQLELRIIDRYKNIKWVLGYGRAVQGDTPEERYFDGFIMDISDRKKMESALISAKEKAEQAATTRAAFLANMSHEIRTPMNAIIGFSDILLDEKLNNNQRKQLNTINQSAKSLLHILNDVLDSAKLDKGKFQLEYRDFYLVEEVDSVVSTLWLQAQHKGLQINLNIDKDTQCFYNGVPDRLRQVLTNIIGNAVKFTEEGSVTITIKNKQTEFLHFAVSDTGIGMTQTQLDSVFEPFAQADESMSRRFGGTGLGTTISKQLIELMGGSISAKSEKGKGSTFEFSIPMKLANVPTQSKLKEIYTELPQLSVLIVDDIEQNIDLMSLILKRNNHSFAVARNGEQALHKMENERFDIVLMDIQMPVMDGLTASKKRREYEIEHGLSRLPIIALTASVLPQDRKSAEESGMDGFANKPIDLRQLLNEIAKVLTLNETTIDAKESKPTQQVSIDIEKGIDLWGSKTTLFNEIVQFLNQSKNNIAALSALIKNEEWLTVESTAHKYKGAAGNLALNRLMLALTALEDASLKHKQQEAIASLENIELEINAITQCTKKMSTRTYQEAEKEHTSHEVLLATLLKLEVSVENNEFDDDQLDILQAVRSNYNEEIKAVITACNDFDFELALNHIKVLIQSIKSSI